MPEAQGSARQSTSATAEAVQAITGSFVRNTLQQYRAKLLDLSSRNPLISFRHSERSRSHLRVIHEAPELLFSKLQNGKQLSFDAVPEPVLIPEDEEATRFQNAFRELKRTNEEFAAKTAELGPSPSVRQKRRMERTFRDLVRQQLGMPPFSPATDARARAAELGINPEYELLNGREGHKNAHGLRIQTLLFRDDLNRKLGSLRDASHTLLRDAGFNSLYCAFGFLEYYDTGASEEKKIAPLVFCPIELERSLTDGEY